VSKSRPLSPRDRSPRHPLDRRMGRPPSLSGRGGKEKSTFKLKIKIFVMLHGTHVFFDKHNDDYPLPTNFTSNETFIATTSNPMCKVMGMDLRPFPRLKTSRYDFINPLKREQSRGNSVQRLGYGLENRGSIPCRNRLWGPSSLLSNGYRGHFLGDEVVGA
jgi:hypothetical protein